MFWEEDFYDAVNHVDHRQDMRLDIEDMTYEVSPRTRLLHTKYLHR